MRDIGSGRHNGTGTLPCLIGEYAALHAHGYRGADNTAAKRVDSERALDYACKHCGHLLKMV